MPGLPFRSERRRAAAGQRAPVVPLQAMGALGWLVVAIVAPVGVFFLYSFWTSGLFEVEQEWTLDNYQRVLTDPLYRSTIVRTLVVGLSVAAITVPLAYAAAYVLTFKMTKRWRNRLLVLIALSIFSSYLVRIYAWKVILGPEGIVNRSLETVGIINEPLDFLLYGQFAVILTLVNLLLPYAILPIFASLQNVQADVVRAGRDLGAGPALTFARVTLPLSWHGTATAFVLIFILAAGDYVTPALVGGRGGSMAGRVVYDQFIFTGDWPFGAALAFTLVLAFALVLVLGQAGTRLLTTIGPSLLHASRRVPRRRGRRARWFPWSRAYIGLVLAFLYFPLALIALFSFTSGTSATFPIEGLTLDWYSEALGRADFTSAVGTSLKVAAITTLVSVVCGVAGAWALARRRFRARKSFEFLLLLPWLLPGILIGVAMLSTFALLGLHLSLVSIALVHVAIGLPFVTLVVTARLQNFDRSAEEAARDLGCTPRKALQRVTFPIILPTVVSSAVLVFALSMNEFVITLFVAGRDVTLPLLTWGLIRFGVPPSVNAISTVMLVGSVALLGAAALLMRLRGHGRGPVAVTYTEVAPPVEDGVTRTLDADDASEVRT
jgi:ABC-type spermidine/putrescine transport system permease subunit II